MEIVKEETYTFTPNNGEEPVSIWSGRLRKWLMEKAQDKVIELTFPNETLLEHIERHGIELSRLASMTEEEASEPVIVGFWTDGTHILIDGAHRRAYWSQRGVDTIKGWAVPEAVWRAYSFDPKKVPAAYHHPDGSLLPQRMKK